MFENNRQYRLFLAIVPPADVRALVRDNNRLLKRYSRNFKFVPIEQLHITLQFIGDSVSADSIDILSSCIDNITKNYGTFEVTLDKFCFGFPGQNIPSILYYSLERDERLRSLVKDLHSSIKELSLPDVNRKKDHAKLINHLTAARTKKDLSGSFGRTIQDELRKISFQPMSFEVEEVHLVSSVFNNSGTTYASLVTFPLIVGTA